MTRSDQQQLKTILQTTSVILNRIATVLEGNPTADDKLEQIREYCENLPPLVSEIKADILAIINA